MCWLDFNTDDSVLKTTFWIGQCVKRIVYAWALVTYK